MRPHVSNNYLPNRTCGIGGLGRQVRDRYRCIRLTVQQRSEYDPRAHIRRSVADADADEEAYVLARLGQAEIRAGVELQVVADPVGEASVEVGFGRGLGVGAGDADDTAPRPPAIRPVIRKRPHGGKVTQMLIIIL